MGLNLRRAAVDLGDGTTYAKVAIVISGGVARLWDASGNLLAEGEVATHEQTGPGEHVVTMTDGRVWSARKVSGCGCGA
jgi:hypothetical protein